MNLNITVIGNSNKKYINRICTGQYNDNITKTLFEIHTNIGLFNINFSTTISTNTEYLIFINDDNFNALIYYKFYYKNNIIIPDNLTKLLLINYNKIPKIKYENIISIKHNYNLLFPIIKLIREKTKYLNIYQIKTPIESSLEFII